MNSVVYLGRAVAGNEVACGDLFEFGHGLGALGLSVGAAGAERAAGGGIQRAGDIALKSYTLVCPCYLGVGHGHGGHERL